MDKETLELVDTDDLLVEIMQRFEHAVFCGLKAGPVNAEPICGMWHGSPIVCSGLAAAIGQDAMRSFSFADGEEESD